MTISFGESTGSTLANWGFVLLILAIFLFFTGLWQTISRKWNGFFGSSIWTQTIGNAKATWNSVPQQSVVQPLPTATVPSPALMPAGSVPNVVPVVTPAGVSAPAGTLPVAAVTSPPPSPLVTT